MDTIIGLLIIYAWIHSVIIVSKKIENQTSYETGVLILGLVGLILFFIGTTM